MKKYLLIVSLFAFSDCMLYLPRETKIKLDSENGYFFVKASDYTDTNYFYIHLKTTNIMLNNLEYCEYNSVPKDESISKCEFITFIPHKSDTDTVSNIINDYYQFEKYRRSYSFIIFHYSGDYQPNFEIEVEGLNDLNEEKTGNKEKTGNNGSNATTIILIVLCVVLACALIIAITFLVILARRNKIGPNAEEAHNAIPNQDYPLND